MSRRDWAVRLAQVWVVLSLAACAASESAAVASCITMECNEGHCWKDTVQYCRYWQRRTAYQGHSWTGGGNWTGQYLESNYWYTETCTKECSTPYSRAHDVAGLSTCDDFLTETYTSSTTAFCAGN